MNNTNESSNLTSSISNSQRIKHKIIFLGDQYVGKTCIIERFMYDVFDEKSHPTVGVDFLAKSIKLDDKNIRLQLWDTAGQERFRSLIPSYLRDATCAIIVFDVTNKESFNNIERWLKDYRDNRGNDASCVLIGNKIDMKQIREISQQQAEEKGKMLNMLYFDISAKTGENVQNMFLTMAKSLIPIENNNILKREEINENQANIEQQQTAQQANQNSQQNQNVQQQKNIKLVEQKQQQNQQQNQRKGCC
ncbi:Ras family protein, putative [Ichthyophthirius multifiliis]|uniref:Ras family protein, putative n=1 Tax=Ichthyophthirius multifiliis TaxID=5932 RepID=G0QR01_ICHMU|nr:Ras family protein, putative [Ichthyophthirius multifiliis]EGR32356.1 Ras family protein, putative [Ichthyophthirius multifiliis]|eukprot:XP_004035842.1 Ras family protein, putative [Ichthyophthirius multifiliis]